MFWSAQQQHHAYLTGPTGGNLSFSADPREHQHNPHLVLRLTVGQQGIGPIYQGLAATPETKREALKAIFGLDGLSRSLSVPVPSAVRASLAKSVQEAVARLAARYGGFGTENHITGMLFDKLDGEWACDGWTVRVRTQEYSPNVKEPKLGADAGILVEIRDGSGARVVKVAWLQAKRVDVLPKVAPRDAALDEQMKLMRTRTKDSYAILYAATGVDVRGGAHLGDRWNLDDWLDGLVECTRGERRLDVILDTFDGAHVLTVMINQDDGARPER